MVRRTALSNLATSSIIVRSARDRTSSPRLLNHRRRPCPNRACARRPAAFAECRQLHFSRRRELGAKQSRGTTRLRSRTHESGAARERARDAARRTHKMGPTARLSLADDRSSTRKRSFISWRDLATATSSPSKPAPAGSDTCASTTTARARASSRARNDRPSRSWFVAPSPGSDCQSSHHRSLGLKAHAHTPHRAHVRRSRSARV